MATWNDFPEIADDSWNAFPEADDYVSSAFQGTGLEFLDPSGVIARETSRNLTNPEFDPAIYGEMERYRDRRARSTTRRSELLAEDPEPFLEVPFTTRAILGAGQGAAQLGRAAGGVLDSFGLDAGDQLADFSRERSQEYSELGQSPKSGLGGDFLQWLTSGAMSFIPSAAGGILGGLPLAVAAAAAQQYGSTFADAKDSYIAQGDDEETAKAKAYLPAIVSGGITAAVTRGFGNTGVEALRRGITATTVGGIVREVIKDAGMEAAEEGIDQIGQGITAKLTYDPEKTVGQIVTESIQAATLGGILGGAAGVGRTGVGAAQRAAQPEAPIQPVDEWAEFPEQEQIPTIEFQEAFVQRDLPSDPVIDPTIDINQPLTRRAARRRAQLTGVPDAIETGEESGRFQLQRGGTDQIGPSTETIAGNRLLAAAPVQAQTEISPVVFESLQTKLIGSVQLKSITMAERFAIEDAIKSGNMDAWPSAKLGDFNRYLDGAINQEIKSAEEHIAETFEKAGKKLGSKLVESRKAFGHTFSKPNPEYLQFLLTGEREMRDRGFNLFAATAIEGGDSNAQVAQEKEGETILEPRAIRQGAAFKVHPRPDGQYDVLDAIQELGGIASPKQNKRAVKGGEYDGFGESFGFGEARLLIRGKGGQQPDLLRDELASLGFTFDSTSQMYDAVDRASRARKEMRANPDKTQDFLNAALDNKGRGATVKAAPATPTTVLNPGDKFDIKKVPFEVQSVDPDTGEVTVKDGPKYKTQTLPPATDFYPDKGTLETVPELSVDQAWPVEPETELEYRRRYQAEKEKIRENIKLRNNLEARLRAERAGVTIPVDQNLPSPEPTVEQGAEAEREYRRKYNAEREKIMADVKFRNNTEAQLRAERAGVASPQPAVKNKESPAQLIARISKLDRQINQLKSKPQLFPEDFRRLEMLEKERGQIFIPGTEAPLRPVDQELFQGQIATEPGTAQPLPTQQAQGIDETRKMVLNSTLPLAVKNVIVAMLETPALQDLDWQGLVVVLQNDESGTFGARRFGFGTIEGATVRDLIQLTEKATAAAFPHEMFHIFYDFLPASYKAAIEQARIAEITAKYGQTAPEALLSGEMTSRDFQEQAEALGLEQDDYHLINGSEYLSGFAGNKFAQEVWNRRHGGDFLKKLTDWFKALWDAITRTFQVSPSMERIYREVLAGKHKPDLATGIEFEQWTYSGTGEEATNAAALARTQEEREIEATHQLAQAEDIFSFLTKFGANAAGAATQKILRFFDYSQIREVGTQLNSGVAENYRQLKTRISDVYKRNWLSRLAATQVAKFEATLSTAVKDGVEAIKEMHRSGFLKLLVREAKAKQNALGTETLDRVAGAMFDSAFKVSQSVLEEEQLNDVDIAKLQAQLNEIDEARKSSSAMSQLVTDMVTLLSSTAEGQQLLNDPNFGNRTDILDLYKDLKQSTGQPLHSEALLRWASFILRRNAELKDTLWAQQLARNSNIRAQMGAYEKKFLADLEANPLKTIRREIRAAKKRTSDFEKARFTWMQLHKDVTDQLEKFGARIEAGEIASQILADPDFIALRNEMFTDAGQTGTAKVFQPFTDKTLLLPDGTQIDTDVGRWVGSKTEFDRTRAGYLKAASDLRQWLAQNPDDPNWWIHHRNLDTLQNYFTSQAVLRPNDVVGAWDIALTMVRNAIDIAGGRVAAAAKKAANEWNRIKQQAGWWNQRWSERITEARIKSMRSHGLDWKAFRGRDIVEANRLWWENAGNILAYSHSRQQGGFKLGDQLPSGWTVTEEDLADLRLQADAITAGFTIIQQQQYTEDDLAGLTLYRKAIKGSENMVRRTFNYDLRNGFANKYVEHRKAFQDAFRSKNQQAQQDAEDRMVGLLNQYWDKIGYAFVWDRNPDFAKATAFDGAGGVFEQISQGMLSNPNYVTSFDQLLDEIVSLSTLNRDDAKQIVMVEFGRIINLWYQEAKNDTEGGMLLPKAEASKNATTKSRNKALAPYVFYEYGFKDSRSVATFAGALHSRPLDVMIGALRSIVQDIERQQGELEQAKDRKVATDRTTIERANGVNYDNWQKLESRKKKVEVVLKHLTAYDPLQDVDVTFGRTMGGVVGLLISGIRTTARNFTMGPLPLGAVINRLNASALVSYPGATFFSYLNGIKVFGSLAGSLAKSIAYAPVDIPKAIMRLARGDVAGAIDQTFRRLIIELGDEAYNRIKGIREMRDKNLLFIPDFEREFTNRVYGSLLYQGRIAPNELSVSEKIKQLPAALMEVILIITKTFSPTAGDVAINAGTYQFMNSSMGPIRHMENRLRELYSDWTKNKYRRFNFTDPQDPVNTFSTAEIFPTKPWRVTGNDGDISELRRMFVEAGIQFDEAATRFIADLDAGNMQAQFLTAAEREALSLHAIDLVNRSSPTAMPLALQEKTFIKNMVSPFMFWKSRTFSLFNRRLNVPAVVGKTVSSMAQLNAARSAQWAIVGAMVFLPMLLLNAFIQIPVEDIDRRLARLLHNQEKSSRHPWEREDTKSQAIGWTINAVNGIPFVDTVMNGMLNDLPTRASLRPSLASFEKIQDVMNWWGGFLQTGNPMFRLPELIAGFVPDAKIIFNRLDSEEGKRESGNAMAILRRKGPTDNLRQAGGPVAGVNYTELSPYGPAMENAAMRGDMPELYRLYNEAINKATELGRPEPERTVRQMFSSRNPFDRVFKQKLSEGQYSAFLARLSPDELATIKQVEQRFGVAADALDARFTSFKQERGGGQMARVPTRIQPASSLLRRGGRGGARNLSLRRTRRTRLSGRRSLRRGSRRTR